MTTYQTTADTNRRHAASAIEARAQQSRVMLVHAVLASFAILAAAATFLVAMP